MTLVPHTKNLFWDNNGARLSHSDIGFFDQFNILVSNGLVNEKRQFSAICLFNDGKEKSRQITFASSHPEFDLEFKVLDKNFMILLETHPLFGYGYAHNQKHVILCEIDWSTAQIYTRDELSFGSSIMKMMFDAMDRRNFIKLEMLGDEYEEFYQLYEVDTVTKKIIGKSQGSYELHGDVHHYSGGKLMTINEETMTVSMFCVDDQSRVDVVVPNPVQEKYLLTPISSFNGPDASAIAVLEDRLGYGELFSVGVANFTTQTFQLLDISIPNLPANILSFGNMNIFMFVEVVHDLRFSSKHVLSFASLKRGPSSLSQVLAEEVAKMGERRKMKVSRIGRLPKMVPEVVPVWQQK